MLQNERARRSGILRARFISRKAARPGGTLCHTVSARLLRNLRKRHGAKILYVAGGFSRQRNTN
ncbi:hypothetical protein, partial [Rhodoblastus sp.]|uniref:hypothetical protein n=1 Tax=Rhodoblastus sp. TaxID=1962975 RepID=UPI003F9A12CD